MKVQHNVQREYYIFFHFFSSFFQQKILQFNVLQDFSLFYIVKKWSWRDSNSRPNEELICFLHAYLRLDFRVAARPKPPTTTLFPLFHTMTGTFIILSPILLCHLVRVASKPELRVTSRPNTLCKD